MPELPGVLRRLAPIGHGLDVRDDPWAVRWGAGWGPGGREVWSLRLGTDEAGFWFGYELSSEPEVGGAQARLVAVSFVRDGRGGEVARYSTQPTVTQGEGLRGPWLELGGGRIAPSAAVGSMWCPEGQVTWNLSWVDTHVPVRLGHGHWLSPTLEVRGSVKVGARLFEIEGARGSLVHRWSVRGGWAPFTLVGGLQGGDGAKELVLAAAATRWFGARAMAMGMVRSGHGSRSMVGPWARLRSRLVQVRGGWDLRLEAHDVRVRGLVTMEPAAAVQIPSRTGHGLLVVGPAGVAEVTLEKPTWRGWREAGRYHGPLWLEWAVATREPLVRRMGLPAS